MQSPKIIRVGSVFRYAYTTLFIKQHIYVRAYRGLQNSLTYQNRCFRQRVAAGGAELPGISDPVFPIKSSRVPLARFKRLTVNMLYYKALEACQRHAATFRAKNHLKLKFCNTSRIE